MSMERSSYRYPVIVGFFVTLGTLILVLAIFTLGGQRGTFLKTKLVRARFEDIGGLKKGDNVWLSGVKVGMIREINIEGRRNVVVTLGIDAHVDSLIRRDSRVRISSDGIMGNRIVVIYGGSIDQPMLEEQEIIEADLYADPQELFRTLGNSSRDVADLAANLRDISKEILDGQGVLGRLLRDSMWSQTLVSASEGLHRTIDKLERTATHTNRIIQRIGESAEQLHKPGNLAYGILEDTTFYQNLIESSEKLRTGMETLTTFSKALEQSGKAITGEKGLIGTLIYDSVSAGHLRHSLHNLDSASGVLETDLRALQESIFLRRYFRRMERKEKQQGKSK